MADGVDTAALARSLIQPLQHQYAEVLVYFHARGAETDLPLLRVQWTPPPPATRKPATNEQR